jgi:hypothetical protein
MGVSVWTFVRPRSGEMRPVAERAVERFIAGEGPLQVDADGFVRYAQVIVNLENRRATEVIRVDFFQYRALKSGKLDRKYFREILQTIPEAAFGWLQLTEPPKGVVVAEHKFANRRLQHLNHWKPSAEDRATLRSLVNRKAGRELL